MSSSDKKGQFLEEIRRMKVCMDSQYTCCVLYVWTASCHKSLTFHTDLPNASDDLFSLKTISAGPNWVIHESMDMVEKGR